MNDLINKVGVDFTKWQKDLIFEVKIHGKRKDVPETVETIEKRQVELHNAAAAGPDELGKYLRDVLELGTDEQIDAPALSRERLTPSEFREPPVELEKELNGCWEGKIDRHLASQPVFWFLCHIEWIEQCKIGETGTALQECLFEKGGRSKSAEDKTRNFLRRTGGLFAVRGNVSVLSDCPLARAWWRCLLAKEVEEASEGRITRDDAHQALHWHNPSWEELVRLCLRHIVVINEPKARAAVVWHLHDLILKEKNVTKHEVKRVAQVLARQGLRRSLHLTPWEELRSHSLTATPPSLEDASHKS